MIKRILEHFGFVHASAISQKLDELQVYIEKLSAREKLLCDEIDALKSREKSIVKHIVSLFKHVIVGKKDIEHVLQGSQVNTERLNALSIAMNEMAAGMQGICDMLTAPRTSIDQSIALPDMPNAKKKGEMN
jgi:hypothetical protein